VEIESQTDEVKRLQRCINDLVSVLALPAIWSGHESSLVANTLLDVLVQMLRLDFAYVRVVDFAEESPKEWIRSTNGSHRDAQAQEIGRTLEPYLAENPPRASLRIPNPFGEGTALIAVFHLGLQESVGVFVAGSRRPEFPTETERLLLQVAMNQAAIAFQEARYVSQRRRTTEDLERRVVERTAELTAVNEALRQEIVERARAEEEVQQSEAQFQLAIDTIRADGGTFPEWATFHDLRHFYASLLIGRGCNVKQVQTVLGHLLANAETARKIIVDVIPQIPTEPNWPEHFALDSALVTDRKLWPAATVEKLKPILKRFL